MSGQTLQWQWYCISADGLATLCADEDDAKQNAKVADMEWPRNAPHRAVQLVCSTELQKVIAQRDELLVALKGVLSVANVQIDDPRIVQFDNARAAIANVEKGAA